MCCEQLESFMLLNMASGLWWLERCRDGIDSYPVSTASFFLHLGKKAAGFSNMQKKAGSGDWVQG